MKILAPFLFPLVLLFFLSSASSSCVKTVTVTDTLKINDTATVIINDTISNNSILNLLTGKKWQYDSLYYGYTGPGTGTLQYARGANNNVVDVDNVIGVYWPDGTGQYFDQYGNYNALTWSFLHPGDSTNFEETVVSYPTIYGRILRLDATHFNVYDSTNSALDIEVYIP